MKQRLYLVAYDIANPKRLGRVARYLCQHACRVQYSVFVAALSKSRLKGLLSHLETVIDPQQDDIRAYPLLANGEITLLGNQFLAAETLMLQNGQSCQEWIQDVEGKGA